ncbi:MAG: DUF1937 family protein [Pirellulales bacterium]|nr:DUF1937 family protein [Pirellulales bacterium]
MIYLASPYTHPSGVVRRHRYWEACRALAGLLRAGLVVVSPIVLGHPLVDQGLPAEWAWWEPIDRALLERCDEVLVLTLDGWEASVGVAAEIRIAGQLGKPVRYLAPEDQEPAA